MYKDEYREILRQKAEQAEQIFDLTANHHLFIEQEEIGKLESSLNSRERCINSMKKIDASLVELEPETEGWMKDGEIAALYEHINSLIRQSIEMDEENYELGKGKLKEYSSKLKEGKAARKGMDAYMGYTAVSGSFDQKR